ncbi:MAG: DUF427 domain-containing protein [Janthinobacterium lividum]
MRGRRRAARRKECRHGGRLGLPPPARAAAGPSPPAHRLRRPHHRRNPRRLPRAGNLAPPVYYLPPDAFTGCTLEPAPGRSLCEWKGAARYWTIRVGDRAAERCAWSYPEPTPAFAPLRDHLAVYAGAMDQCLVGDEIVTPQPGGFYGGWVTRDLKGPFKGGPGTMGW